jgi:hypothetical protein
MEVPAAVNPVEVVDFTRLIDEVAPEAGMVTDEVPEATAWLCESVALAVAVLVTEPASTSDWVVV